MTHADRNRRWRQAHLEHSRALDKRHRLKHTETRNAKARAYHAENRDALNEKQWAYRQAHKELLHVQRIAQYKARAPEIREKARANWRKQYAANPERFCIKAQAQKAKRKGALGILKRSEWEAIKAAYGGRCAYCKTKPKRLTVDHVLPLVQGGRNDKWNIVPACASCNRKKGVALWNVQIAAAL